MVPSTFEAAVQVMELEGESRREEFDGDEGSLAGAAPDDGASEGPKDAERHVREVGIRGEPAFSAKVERNVQSARHVSFGELLDGADIEVGNPIGEELRGFRWRHVFQGGRKMSKSGKRRKRHLRGARPPGRCAGGLDLLGSKG